ncbi:MAG: hypothetical protein FWG83_03280 [Oscillospiraceae bacterium]|nr:hypothetical protein [Oscillospiraceae bacterium]
MSKYTVNISSYDAFRKDTFGKLFDTDNAYGSQCFDAADLLWRQLKTTQPDGSPRRLRATGGAAMGAWDVSVRATNAGTEFDIIADVTKIKRGDVIVFGTKLGAYGHIGFADEDYKTPAISTYSQNQGGTNGVGQAAAFTVRSYTSAGLIGAFRFKAWNAPPPPPNPPSPSRMDDALEMLKQLAKMPNTAPPDSTIGDVLEILKELAGMKPSPAPNQPEPKKTVEQVAQEIWRGQGDWGTGEVRKQKLIAYGGEQFQKDVQARLNQLAAGK